MANNATLAEPVGTTPAPGSFKRRARRLGTVTGAVFGLIALGIAFAFFLSTNAIENNTAEGGEVVINASGLPMAAADLFPTAASDGGENAVEKTFTITNGNGSDIVYTLAARCQDVTVGADGTQTPTQNADGEGVPCQPGDTSASAVQYEQLEVRVTDSAGNVLYQGRLADMNGAPQEGTETPGTLPIQEGTYTAPSAGSVALGTVAEGDAAEYTVRIWLDETGQEQPQNVLSAWIFDVSGQTV